MKLRNRACPVGRCVAYLLCCVGLFLLAVDVCGVFISLRVPQLSAAPNLRFSDDITLTHHEVKKALRKNDNESDQEYAIRINSIIQKGVAHIDWENVDPVQYRLRVPVWENYILYLMSFSPVFDDCQRYHFSDYKKGIERGVGLCGDAAVYMSGVMQSNHIKARIVAFDGHVINEINIDDGRWWVFDPDFGVIIPMSLDQMKNSLEQTLTYYKTAGYSDNDINVLKEIYKSEPTVYENVYAFGPTKYLVERISYVLIWVFPAILVGVGLIGIRATRKHT